MRSLQSVHVFCEVIDNFGDAGVCWRLSRALAAHGLQVTLWIDDPGRLQRLRPMLDPARPAQAIDGLWLRHWRQAQAEPLASLASSASPASPAHDARGGAEEVADLVIAAFGCRLPHAYLAAMAARPVPPVWLNLEYLSAEDWVERSHGLPSPHPRLALTEYFYFPGFSAGTGGLLKEAGYDDTRRAFDAAQRQAFLSRLGVQRPDGRLLPDGVPLVSLFCYPDADVAGLFAAMAAGEPVHCVVPEGVTPLAPPAGRSRSVGALTLHGLPFLEPDDYDRLLWSCDLNFVRGEDSAVRAQWACRPMVWQLYPQQDSAHRVKLDAFLARYTAGLPPALAALQMQAMRAWNGVPGASIDTDAGAGHPVRSDAVHTAVVGSSTVNPTTTGSHAPDWAALRAALPALRSHAAQWAAQLGAQRELAAGLIEFARKIG